MSTTIALASSCAPSPEHEGFGTGDPAATIPAILNSVRHDDQTAIPHLVDALGSDDPAVRLMAQDALERLTGTECGYRFSDPPLLRDEAMQRWIKYVRDDPALAPLLQPPHTPAPATAVPTTQ